MVKKLKVAVYSSIRLISTTAIVTPIALSCIIKVNNNTIGVALDATVLIVNFLQQFNSIKY